MPVSKPQLGRRYTCYKCNARFYDLNKPEPLCPTCGADQRQDPNPDPREAILQRYKGRGDGLKGKDLKKDKRGGRRGFEEWEVDDEELEGEEFEDDDIDEDDEDIDDFAMEEEDEL